MCRKINFVLLCSFMFGWLFLPSHILVVLFSFSWLSKDSEWHEFCNHGFFCPELKASIQAEKDRVKAVHAFAELDRNSDGVYVPNLVHVEQPVPMLITVSSVYVCVCVCVCLSVCVHVCTRMWVCSLYAHWLLLFDFTFQLFSFTVCFLKVQIHALMLFLS